MRYDVTLREKEHVVEVEPGTAGHFGPMKLDGQAQAVDAVVVGAACVHVVLDGHAYDVEIQPGTPNKLQVKVRGEVMSLEVWDPQRKPTQGARKKGGAANGQVTSPMPGKVVKLPKKVGDAVKAGECVVVVEAMKMENELRAPADGTIREIPVKEGQTVDGGAVLVVVTP